MTTVSGVIIIAHQLSTHIMSEHISARFEVLLRLSYLPHPSGSVHESRRGQDEVWTRGTIEEDA